MNTVLPVDARDAATVVRQVDDLARFRCGGERATRSAFMTGRSVPGGEEFLEVRLAPATAGFAHARDLRRVLSRMQRAAHHLEAQERSERVQTSVSQ
jgi:hypothetical protein